MEHHLAIVLIATFFSWSLSPTLLVESRATPSEMASLSKMVKGDFSIDEIYNLKQFYGDAKVKVQQILDFSPLLKSIFEEAAKENIKAKILLTFFTGKTPSLDDIIKLATTKSDTIENTLTHIMATDPKWPTITPDNYRNHTVIKNALEQLAGRKIDVTAIKLKNDKYTVSERADIAYYNLLKLFYFVGDNYHPFKQVMEMLGQKSPDYQAMLSMIVNFDYENFPTTMVGSHAQKFSVNNPEASTLLNDVKTKYPKILAQHDSKKVEDAVLNFASVFIDMFGSIFSAAETLGQKESA